MTQTIRKFSRFGILLVLPGLTSTVFGAKTWEITSEYDAATGKWIGNVTELTNALTQSDSSAIINLAKGVYDLSVLTNAPMYSAGGGGSGAALLCSGINSKTYRTIKGATGDPKDVILDAKNVPYRIIAMNGKNSKLYHVTLTGGNAASSHITQEAWRIGGAVVMTTDLTTVSNCVFHGNTAAMRGGAVAGGSSGRNGKVYSSVFYGNDTSSAGEKRAMVACRTTLIGCTITNNVTQFLAADEKQLMLTYDCAVYDSYIADNVMSYSGVTDGVVTNCIFVNNTVDPKGQSYNNAGGVVRNSACSNCYFYGNWAYRRGGAVRGGTIVGCTIVSNRANHATASYGGGVYGASLVENCTVVSNYSGNVGGGLADCTVVRDCTLAYNCAGMGGGSYGGACSNCVFAHNAATDYARSNSGGGGGGLAAGSAEDCVFRDNSASATYACTSLRRCDIADSLVDASNIEYCVLHEIDNAHSALAVGNVAYPNGVAISNMYMIGAAQIMRNSLVTNCNWRNLGGSFANAAMFHSGSDKAESGFGCRVENCTIADNEVTRLMRYYNATNKVMNFINCAIVRNTAYGQPSDISASSSTMFTLSNCVYNVWGDCATRAAGYVDGGCTVLGAGKDPKFVGSGDWPYTPKRTSQLVKTRGLVFDWMENAVDLAGNPMVKPDGAVDIGAFQCWLEAPGLLLMVR